MTDIRDALSHVLWIGGGPQAGKTTLARLLAGKWDLEIYEMDWHLSRGHRVRAGPRAATFGALSMDDRWARPSVEALIERTIAIWEEVFGLVIEDLLALPRSRAVIAEGPGAAPWLVANVISSTSQTIFLLPTAAQRARVEEQRFGPGQVERFPGIVDRPAALANVRARDARLDERIARSCAELGLRCEVVDATRALDANLALIEQHFRAFLPAAPNA